MSGHSLPYEMLTAPWLISDPGDAGTLNLLDKGLAICQLVTAAAETRTVPAPSTIGQTLILFLDTDGGNCTITVNSGHNVTTLVMDDAGDAVQLDAISVGGTVKWLLTRDGDVAGRTIQANLVLNSLCVDQAIFTADRPYQVVGVTEIHATAGNDAAAVNLQLTKDTGTNAPGAGTDLLTNNTNAGFDLKGSANTLQTGTLVATEASLQLAAGDRLSLDFAGTITTLAGVQVTVSLRAID